MQNHASIKQLMIASNALTDVSGLRGMDGLKTLSIYGDKLETIGPVGRLPRLDAINLSCYRLKTLAGLEEVTTPTKLNLRCDKLTSLKGIEGMSSLAAVNIYECNSLIDLNELENKNLIRTLSLVSCKSLSDIEPLNSLDEVVSLRIHDCQAIRDISPIAAMTSLTRLEVSQTQVKDLRHFTALENLTDLTLSSSVFKSLKQAEKLSQLELLSLSGCDGLERFDGLREMVNLKHLNLSHCDELRTLKPIQNLSKLQSLNLSFVKNRIHDMDLINKLPTLAKLEMREVPWLQDVDFFSNRCGVKELRLGGCDSLVNFSGLKKLSKLKFLDLQKCNSLKSLEAFKTLPLLTYLNLRECSAFQSCVGIENLPALEELDLTDTAVERLRFTHANLQILDTFRCQRLKEIDVSGLDKIQNLKLSSCKSLKTVCGLSRLHWLQEVCVSANESLESVGVLSDLPELLTLNIHSCPKLKMVTMIDCNSLSDIPKTEAGDGLDELWMENCEALTYMGPLDVYAKKLTIKNCGISQLAADRYRELHPEIQFDYEPKQ